MPMFRRSVLLPLLLAGMMVMSACNAPASTPQPTAGTAAEPTAAQATTAPAAADTGSTASMADQGACTAEAANKPMPTGNLRLVIGTGGTGGVFYPYGGGIAKVITEKMGNAEATAEVTGGSVDNMKLIQAKEADIGLSTVDSAYDAIKGQGSYKDTGSVPACALAVLYPSFLHVVAREDSGIKTVADMKGKQISVGSAGSSTEDAADRVLEAAGLNPETDIKRDNLSVAESTAAMKDGKVDAFFWIGGLPTAAVTDLVSTGQPKIIFLPTGDFVKTMTDKYGPVYSNFALPAGTYSGFDQDIPGIGINNIMFVNAEMPEELAYKILKTLFDNLDDVKQIHPEAKKLSLDKAIQGSSIPFHPGAVRFFKEQGVWK